jgi:tripartite-type tricarboxylate transporter receptor subunit TctC
VSSARRSPALPSVPTVTEAIGLKDFDVILWAGIFAPRKTPTELVARLNQEINSVLKQPEVKDSLARSGAEVNPMTVTEFASFLKSETNKYDALVKNEFCSKLLYGGCGGFGTSVNLLP